MATGRDDLSVMVRYRGRPVDNRVVGPGEDLLPDTPVVLSARRIESGFVVAGEDGEHAVAPVAVVQHGDVAVEIERIRRTRFERFGFAAADAVLPVLIITAMLAVVQVKLLLSLAHSGGGPPVTPEPSPEYIARLLDGQYEGKGEGVLALPADRPSADVKVESYYLPAGADGPHTRLGGGKNVGKKRHDGKRDGTKVEDVAPAPEVTETPVQDAPAVADAAPTPDAAEDDDGEDEAVEITQGWGLTDWYDTQDARKDADQIKRELRYAKELLRLDPDDRYGLSIKSYYEYLAMDFDQAKRTYEHALRLDPEDPAVWNNLALLYKRQKDYKKEEELYQISLKYGPDDPNTLNNLAVCYAHQGRFDEALAIMKRLEGMTPDEPYADLHRAKIYALMGRTEQSYSYLRKSLAAMRKLDTLHNIEYQQDIRVDPAFEHMRDTDRFHRLLLRYYGERPGGWWMLPGRP